MSELVVNLADPESVELARRILDMLGNDWPSPITSSASAEPTTPPWEGPDEIDRSGRSQSDSKADDADPWATSAQSPTEPRAARSAPSTGNQAGTSTPADDDNPWS